MAKYLRNFAPGLADVTPTADYCEAIFYEQRCEASSYWDPIYGSECGRFCIHGVTQTQGNLYEPLPKTAIIDVWSAGGRGGGGCCCTQGVPGSGGAYGRACMEVQPGEIFCYVVSHGGCCVSRRQGYHGCFSGVFSKYYGKHSHINDWKQNQGSLCVCGGMCGASQCFFDYCCYDRTGEGTGGNRLRAVENDSDSSPGRQHTLYKYGCHHNVAFPAGRGMESFDNLSSDKRRPWMTGKYVGFIRNNKNCVPKGRCLINQGYHDTQFRCDVHHGERCAAWGTCVRTFQNAMRDVMHQPSGDPSQMAGHVASECYNGCAAWSCSNKLYSSVSCPRTGVAMFNHTSINSSMARGGYQWSQWYLCHNGSNNNLCYSNIRTAGFGSATGKFCQAAGICCGGWSGQGLVVVKYK